MIEDPELHFLNRIDQPVMISNKRLEILYLNHAFQRKYKITLNKSFQKSLYSLFDRASLDSIKELSAQSNRNNRFQLIFISPYDATVPQKSIVCTVDTSTHFPDSIIFTESGYEKWLEPLKLLNIIANDLVGIINEKLEIEYISPSVRELLAYTPPEFLTTNPYSLIHPQDLPGLQKKIPEAIARRAEHISLTARLRKKDGEYRWTGGNLRIVYDPDLPESFRVIAVLFDLQDKVAARKKTDFSIVELLTQLIDSYKPQALEQGIDIILHTDPSIPQWMHGCDATLHQILDVLLENTLETAAGTVNVRAKMVSQDSDTSRIQFSIERAPEGNEAAATIHTDTGLALVNELAQQLNGTFSSEAGVQGNITHIITLPFDPIEAPVHAVDQSEYGELAGKKILYVEDVGTNQYLIQNILKIYNADCDIGPTGSKALELLSIQTYDLLLLDIQLPDISGYELLNKTQGLAPNNATPVIVFTADETGSAKLKISDPRVKEYVYKPFRSEDLLQRMCQVLSLEAELSMGYFEKIFKKNKEKLEKARDLMLNDLDEFQQTFNDHVKNSNLPGIRESIHKIKVTVRNVHALKAVHLIEHIHEMNELDGTFNELVTSLNEEMKSIRKFLEAYQATHV